MNDFSSDQLLRTMNPQDLPQIDSWGALNSAGAPMSRYDPQNSFHELQSVTSLTNTNYLKSRSFF